MSPGTAFVRGSKIAPHFFKIGLGVCPSSIGFQKIKNLIKLKIYFINFQQINLQLKVQTPYIL